MFTLPHVTDMFTKMLVYFHSNEVMNKHLFLFLVALFRVQAQITILKSKTVYNHIISLLPQIA